MLFAPAIPELVAKHAVAAEDENSHANWQNYDLRRRHARAAMPLSSRVVHAIVRARTRYRHKMNVLFLTIAFPDLEAGSNLYGDLALELAARGHTVHVAALRERKHGKDTFLSVQRGVQVLHVASGDFFDVGFVRKGLTTLALEGDFRRALRRTWPQVHFDLAIPHTPPITFVGLLEDLKRVKGSSTYLILRDIFPQNAVDVGVMRKGLAYRYFRRVERRCTRPPIGLDASRRPTWSGCGVTACLPKRSRSFPTGGRSRTIRCPVRTCAESGAWRGSSWPCLVER